MLPTPERAENGTAMYSAQDGLISQKRVEDDGSAVRREDQIDSAPGCFDGCWSAILKAGVSFFASIDYWRTRPISFKYSSLPTSERRNILEALAKPCEAKTQRKYPTILPDDAVFSLDEDETHAKTPVEAQELMHLTAMQIPTTPIQMPPRQEFDIRKVVA